MLILLKSNVVNLMLTALIGLQQRAILKVNVKHPSHANTMEEQCC